VEEFSFARADERTQTSALLTEWLESAKPNFANNTDVSLSFAKTANDKQEPGKEIIEGTGKDQAERLDKELRGFADSKLDSPSHSMLRFQKAVGKFCDTPDKEAAMDELSDTWASLNTRMTIGAEALYKDRKEEIAREPGRKELETNYKKEKDQFFGKLIDLPFEESQRVEDLIRWKDGETKAEHRERIRSGLAGNRQMLDAFNKMEAADDKIEASKSPREKQLDHLLSQIETDSKLMLEQTEKAYVRSSLKN
jgi:hypothetical protein